MKDFAGRVAVVTGAASGIGLAMANRFADEGMKVVLADIESEPLAMAESALKAKGAPVLSVRTDVLDEKQIFALADAAFSTFGNVHVLCNNAGVAGRAAFGVPVWEIPMSDWDWVMGVNFAGVLHGVRAFVPRMLENGDEGHIVNTASMAGLGTASGPYHVSKHGVVVLSEGLYKDFRYAKAKLSASVLCPGWVNTNILDAERNRPAELEATDMTKVAQRAVRTMAAAGESLRNGIPPEEVAQQVFEAIRDDQFYVIPAPPEAFEGVRRRADEIVNLRNPSILP